MPLDSHNKTALVTGGNRGIGFAICQGLLKAGFNVFMGSRSLEKGKAAAAKLDPSGSNIQVLELDVADDQSIQQAFNRLSQQCDRLDVLVNNAGIYPDSEVDILTISRDLLMQTLDVNTFSMIRTVQAFLPLLKKAESARVINYSSGYGQLAGLSANVPSYCLSKLAVNGATIMLADALRSRDIVVNAVDPGWVETDMGGASAPRTPEQGADTAIWLATKASLSESGKLWHDRQVVPY
ncbi:MAG: SDR family oxidoreductase [Synechococcales bacterium]|nr:SDR family oxidoreductase [Synechococcales bacterium]